MKMNQKMMKRAMMFAWITEEELEWLLMLDELEERKDELRIKSIADGLTKLSEDMDDEEMKQRDRALLGLQEEGIIQMETEYLEYLGSLDISEDSEDLEDSEYILGYTKVKIKQKGRKLIDEAKCIFEETKEIEGLEETEELEEEKRKLAEIAKLREMEKKEKLKEVGIEILNTVICVTKTAASIILEKVFRVN